MLARFALPMALGLLTGLCLAGGARSAWSAPPAGYLPRTDSYIVVSPTPAAPSGSFAPQGHAAHTWRAQRVSAPSYPWGWFGARFHVQPSRGGSYYDDSRDFIWRRTP